MGWRYSFIGFALCLLAPRPTPAAEPSQRPPMALTLDHVLALARHNNRDLKAAQARLEQASAGVEQAWAALLPTAAAQGRYTHNYKEISADFSSIPRLQDLQNRLQLDAFTDIYTKLRKEPSDQVLADQKALTDFMNSMPSSSIISKGPIVFQQREQLDAALTVSLPLLVPWAYSSLGAAKRSYAAAEAGFRVTEAAILFATAQAFFAAAGADEILIARRHAIEVAQQTVEIARARLAAGVVNRVDVARAELALLRDEQAVVEAGSLQAQAYRTLATIVQFREPFTVVPADEPPARPRVLVDLVKHALVLRPEFHSLEQTLAATNAQASSAKWRWAPTLSAFGNVRGLNSPGFSGDNYSWAVGVQLDWMLYDGGVRDAQRHLAEAQAREFTLNLAQLRDTVIDDLENERSAVATKRRALETARRSVDLSRETIELVRVQYEAGTSTQLDLLQAQDMLVAAEVAVAQARFDLALADLSLRRAAGEFPKRQ